MSAFLRAFVISSLLLVTCTAASAQVANDTCATAIVVTDGVNLGDTSGATGVEAFPTCGLPINDAWYVYTATCTGTATADVCSAPTNYDTVMAAWSGGCGCLNEIACNDDGVGCTAGRSKITFSVNAGVTYYIQIGGFDGGTGPIALTISCAFGPPTGPANDNCATAIAVSEGVLTSGVTIGATTGGGGGCPGDPIGSCNGTMGNDVWYVFTASCSGMYEAHNCGPSTNFDTIIAVWDGSGGCGNLVEVACNDTGGCTLPGLGNVGMTTWIANAGTTYYVSVGGVSGLTGSFDLWVARTGVPILQYFNAGPGSIGFQVIGGPPLGFAFTGITGNQGAFPNGAFFGIDITFQEITDQLTFGYPFFTTLGPCGELTVGPIFGAPSGITIYSVTVTALNGTLVVFSWSAPVSVTIP